MEDCSVCCQPFNNSTRKEIKCFNLECEYKACKTCVRIYLLGQKTAHCMNCKQAWSQKFLIENTNKSYFNNEFKKSRKEILLEAELSRIPSTMQAAEIYKEIKLEEENVKKIDEKLKELKKQMNEIKKERYKHYINIDKLKRTGKKPNEERKKFIMPCPHTNCKGYLSTQYKCEICKLFTCPDCHEIIGHNKDEPHECLKENIDSVILKKKETKPCPNCGIPIFKISGCDQMWCTECEIPFSWNTGKMLFNVQIHNPHFYQRQQQLNNGITVRAPGDVLCGGLCSYYQLRNFVLNPLSGAGWNQTLVYNLTELHRFVNHITNVELYQIRRKLLQINDHEELRILYIFNQKGKKEMADKLYRDDILHKKYIELCHIYELLSVVGIELFTKLINAKLKENKKACFEENISKIKNGILEYDNLITYCNTQLQEISIVFNHTVIQIDKNYHIYNKKFKSKDIENNNEASCSYN